MKLKHDKPLSSFAFNFTSRPYTTEAYVNPTRDARKCAAWDSVYGFYTGDAAGASVEMEVEIVDMDYSAGSQQMGNTMSGVARVTHWYPAGGRFTAMFTGGDRVDTCLEDSTTVTGGCDSKINQMLQNNAGGRFRVTTIVVVPAVSAAVLKRSPEISTPPIIPVELPLKVGDPVRFQVMAYDYDADKMTFRMGTPHEYGGIQRSKLSVVPFAVDPGTGKTVLQDGPYACEPTNQVVVATGRCPTDRVAGAPGRDLHSLTTQLNLRIFGTHRPR